MIKPALLGSQRDKPYAAGTPVHFMAKAGLPPPGIGQHDLCIFCHGYNLKLNPNFETYFFENFAY